MSRVDASETARRVEAAYAASSAAILASVMQATTTLESATYDPVGEAPRTEAPSAADRLRRHPSTLHPNTGHPDMRRPNTGHPSMRHPSTGHSSTPHPSTRHGNPRHPSAAARAAATWGIEAPSR